MRTHNLYLLVLAGLLLAVVIPATAAQRVHNAWRYKDYSVFGGLAGQPKAASVRPTHVGELMEAQLLATGVLRVTNINFVTGSEELTPESREILDQVGRILMNWSLLEVEIAGHTDSRGSRESNQALSEKRAWTVRKYLVTRFPKVREWQLFPVGYGESRPLAANTTADGQAKNRRVEFVVINEDALVRIAEMRAYRSGRR